MPAPPSAQQGAFDGGLSPRRERRNLRLAMSALGTD
jgi:hypothetical protein